MRPLRSDGLLLHLDKLSLWQLLWGVTLGGLIGHMPVGRLAPATLDGRALIVIVRVILVLGAALAFGIGFRFCLELQNLVKRKNA